MKNLMPIAGILAGALFAAAAPAAEITVLSGGAVEPGLNAAAEAFQKSTGHTVKVTYNTTPQIRKRVLGGETFDVVIVPPAAVKEFAGAGKVDAGGADIGKVGMGVVVRPGAPVPDISSADAIKKTVLDAESIVFNTASSGIYFEDLLKKMGIYDQIQSKTARYATGAEVMLHVIKGKGKEVGFGPITEILQYKDKGARLVGPLPAEIQNLTSYTAVAMSAGTQKDAANAFVKYVGGAGKPIFVAAGIE
jgi:molybdate transport system substrate-binding protein